MHEQLILDSPIGDDIEGESYIDKIPSPISGQDVGECELAMLMERQLPVRERQVLELYYNEMLSEKQIAEILGVSQQRVNQIRKKGLNILRMELIMDDQ
ncbi:hypothetical protein AAC03nite_09560 [Alicyclobacillus acidoterrestris]|nr:hypothetical protein AAC03nite_09560 [Alicyclobacillus acidoterrestris]